MKYLITGGAGFIGSHLSEYLVHHGHEVVSVDNLSTGSILNLISLEHNPKFKFFKADIRTSRIIPRLVKQSDAIFHLAASVGVMRIMEHARDSILNNVQGDERMIRLAAEWQKPILVASSSEVYGKRRNEDLTEDDDLVLGSSSVTRWSYAATKVIEEHLALANYTAVGLPVVITRLFNIIGERQQSRYGMVVPRFIRQALKGEPLTVYGTGKQTRSFCYVGDILPIITTLLSTRRAYGQIVNIGNDKSITINSLAKKVITLSRSTSKIIYLPYEIMFNNDFQDIIWRRPNLTKLHSFINYHPKYTLDMAINKIITWINKN